MWGLTCVDGVLPIGDIIFLGGLAILGTISLVETLDDSWSDVLEEETDANNEPSPDDNESEEESLNDIDDYFDEYDDYYDDDLYHGGKEKIGKNKGETPRNNKNQKRAV